MAKAVELVIRGTVQGVGFRMNCAMEAERQGVAGWVANQPDGSVKALFEGEPSAVDRMVEWCREGPAWASVDSVQTSDRSAQGLSGFRVK